MGCIENYKYNRIEGEFGHYYIDNYDGLRHKGKYEYTGFVKCKLIHGKGISLVVPDQIYIEGSDLFWIQPIMFSPNTLSKYEDRIECRIFVDISFGANIEVVFNDNEYWKTYEDGSSTYYCKIYGPENLEKYATGYARVIDREPLLLLYHHTRENAKQAILESSQFMPSKWNIQGTKRLANIAYLYLTPLDSIKHKSDLAQIGMASDGELPFRLDQNEKGDTPDLVLQVYRENTTNRQESIPLWVPAASLAPQPLYRHKRSTSPVYYEIVQYLTHRIGVEPKSVVRLDSDRVFPENPKFFEYIILGDAWEISGLRAPFDEEDVDKVFKIEYIANGTTIHEFWFDNANVDLFSGRDIEYMEFEQSD